MEDKQEQLSLEVEGTMTDEGPLKTLPGTLKVLDRNSRAFSQDLISTNDLASGARGD